MVDEQGPKSVSMSRAATLWIAMAAVAVVSCGSITTVALKMDPPTAVATILTSAVLGVLAVIWQVRRELRAIAALERAASDMMKSSKPLSGGTGQSLGMAAEDVPLDLKPLAGSLRDLGERFQAQIKQAAKNSRNLEALIDAMDEPLLATDNEDRVIFCSRSTQSVFDSGSGDDATGGINGLIGRNIREVFTSAEILEMHALAKAGQVRRGRVRVVTPIGQRTFQVSASPVPAAWGEGVFGAVIALRDVTELDQAVQVKTDFVANASHELRTPVAAIRTAAETLEATGDDPKMSERLRQMILSHAERLEEMLRDLLDLSRLETPDVPLKIERVDLDDLERTLRALAELACKERRLTLAFEMEDEIQGLRTDRKLLLLILRNLVENATKFANENTTVRIVGSVIEAEIAPPLSRSTRPQRDHTGLPGSYQPPQHQPSHHQHPHSAYPTHHAVVRFEVIDKGVGIPLNQQERVFERYYQVDPARTGGGPSWRRGTGLGLAIVKHAAKALHGRVGLSSVWGQGTTVYVEFPATVEPSEGGRGESLKLKTGA